MYQKDVLQHSTVATEDFVREVNQVGRLLPGDTPLEFLVERVIDDSSPTLHQWEDMKTGLSPVEKGYLIVTIRAAQKASLIKIGDIRESLTKN